MLEPFMPTPAERVCGHGYAKFWALAMEKAQEADVSTRTYLCQENRFIVLTDCMLRLHGGTDLRSMAEVITEIVPHITYTEEELVMFLPEYLDHVEDICNDFASREP